MREDQNWFFAFLGLFVLTPFRKPNNHSMKWDTVPLVSFRKICSSLLPLPILSWNNDRFHFIKSISWSSWIPSLNHLNYPVFLLQHYQKHPGVFPTSLDWIFGWTYSHLNSQGLSDTRTLQNNKNHWFSKIPFSFWIHPFVFCTQASTQVTQSLIGYMQVISGSDAPVVLRVASHLFNFSSQKVQEGLQISIIISFGSSPLSSIVLTAEGKLSLVFPRGNVSPWLPWDIFQRS